MRYLLWGIFFTVVCELIQLSEKEMLWSAVTQLKTPNHGKGGAQAGVTNSPYQGWGGT